jgi:gamma-glutamyltranspeptidase/glutathione hydrolase
VIRGIAAAAVDAAVASAAQATLEEGGGAVDAVVAGWLCAAGGSPGALFAPLTLIVAGAGAGARVFDGRPAQPGLGAQRPRGFVRESDVPVGARVAIPRSLAAVTLALGSLARAGVARAEELGASGRASVLRTVGRAASLALRSREVAHAFLAVGGPVAGGIVTEQDLEAALPAEVDAKVAPVGEGGTATLVPWDMPGGWARGGEAVVAVDGRGLVAALAYAPPRREEEILLPDIECSVGPDAEPVRRGVTRVAPGTPIQAAAPIAVLGLASGFAAAVGLPGAVTLDADDLAGVAGAASFEAGLAALCVGRRRAAAIAALRDARDARPLVVRG